MSCHETLWGRFTVSLWGQFLCSKCPVRSCLGCQGLLAKPEDGPNCGRCNSTAVTEDQLVALQAEVMQVLSKYGIEFGAASIPVSLSTQAGLTESSAKSTGRLLGLTQKSHARGSLFRTRRRAEVRTPEYLSLIHISEPTRLLSISYAVFCLKKKKKKKKKKKMKKFSSGAQR
eukprot:TRINITY_DN23516_c0_g1_i2.p2 TRINITY_DN23516_c0_g1~~TRINITY_DN23516_c0_g1_i2.p2  ORF type:complete len:173 (+),score=40.66 TRINITY_DN23516_c0_g1_i2:485-1003(+)